MSNNAAGLCVVTGSTGYLGGRLVPALLAKGYRVRCLVRNPDKLRGIPWAGQVDIVQGDVTDPDQMREACAGADIVYFLVHSLARDNFATLDRRAALITAEAARCGGVGRIIYMGGLHPDTEDLSEHLSSRAEVGDIFLRSGVPTAVLQAGVIIGSGSASFEMLRYLTERLPIMVTPKWALNHIQPIAVRDVLHYLVAAVELEPTVNRTFDVGGPQVLTYQDMMRRYARVAGLPRRRMLALPLLSPKLSSYWINVVTPVPRSVGGPLIESLVNDAVRSECDIDSLLGPPAHGPTSYDESIELALENIKDGDVETRWSDAYASRKPAEPLPSDPDWTGGNVYTHTRELATTASAARLWQAIEGISGLRGWYSFPPSWAAQGWTDRLLSSTTRRRGRRHPDMLRVGDVLDWWRVEAREEGTLLRLRAEMRAPGQAWLELGVHTDPAGRVSYHQRAIFQPHGLAGQLYWRAITPVRDLVFHGMARSITHTAETEHPTTTLATPQT